MVIDIATTSACNYGCLYCSEGLCSKETYKARLPNSKSKVSVDSLKILVNQIRADRPGEKIVFGLWGGEPLLNWQFCLELMEMFAEDEGITFLYYTNGYFIEQRLSDLKQILSRIGKDRLLMQVSYDGQAINDLERLTKSGKSTSETCRKAFKLLRDNGFTVKYKSTLPIQHSDKIFECFREFAEMGEPYFPTPDIAHWYDCDELSLHIRDLEKGLIKIARYIYENKLSPNMFRWFSDSRAKCAAGCNYIAIDVDGMVVPCHGAMYEGEEHRWGNISDVDIWSRIKTKFTHYSELRKSSICKDCNVRYCMSCPAHTYSLIKKGTYDERWSAVNPNTCLVFKVADNVHLSLRSALNKK